MSLNLIEILGLGVGVILIKAVVEINKGTKKVVKNISPSESSENPNFNNGQPGVMSAESSLINQRNYKQNITQEQGEPYPIAFDPVSDFLPRYRWPDGSVWSPAYNPVDSYRPLDYQLTTTLSEIY